MRPLLSFLCDQVWRDFFHVCSIFIWEVRSRYYGLYNMDLVKWPMNMIKIFISYNYIMQDRALAENTHPISDLFERFVSSWLNSIMLKNIRFMVPKIVVISIWYQCRISEFLKFYFCKIQIFIKETDRNNAICVDSWLVSSQLCS